MKKVNLSELPASSLACLLTSEETKLRASKVANYSAASAIIAIKDELAYRDIDIGEFYPDERS